jgi:hypothetical protein
VSRESSDVTAIPVSINLRQRVSIPTQVWNSHGERR